MYAAWNPTPTVSDATKLGLVRTFEQVNLASTSAGIQLYRLLFQASITENFADLDDWTEVDSGANVSLAGGVVEINGSSAHNANGIWYTAGFAPAEGYIEFKFKGPGAQQVNHKFGLSETNALAVTGGIGACWVDSGLTGGSLDVRATAAVLSRVTAVTADTWYTCRFYFIEDYNGDLKCYICTLEGGAEYPNETVVLHGRNIVAMPATVYPQFQRYTNHVNHNFVKEFRWYTGYSAAGPTLIYIFDAGANRRFTDIVLTNIAPVGSWDTTNVTFAWAADDVDGKQAFSAEKTLAQLQALGALGEAHRYFGLRITVNSDGATQQYAGEMNASDLISGVESTLPVYPAVGDVESGVTYGPTGADYTGTVTLPAVADVQSGVQYGAGGVEFAGTFTEPGVGNVESGVQYGGGGVEFTGTFGVPAVGNVRAAVQYGAGGVEFTGTFAVPAQGDVEDGVSFGAGGVEYTGTFEAPAEGDVRDGVGFGAGGVEYTGDVEMPLEADVESGVGYGSGGVEYTGTFVVPAASDVRDGVSFGAGGIEFTGDVEIPAEADVEFGIGFGSGGVEFTGAFAYPLEADVEAGVTYGAAAEFTGTFVVPAEGDVELAVNYGNAAEFTGAFVVPAEANVGVGVGYGDGGVEFTGTLVGGGGLTAAQELLLQEVHALVVQEVGDTRTETPAARAVTSATLAKTINHTKAGDGVTSLAVTRAADT